MKVRIPLNKIELIKTFCPNVKVNSLFIFEKDASNKDIFELISKSIRNYDIFSDSVNLYILFDGIVVDLPINYEISYGSNILNMMISEFQEKTIHLSLDNKSLYLSVAVSYFWGVSKNTFISFFRNLFRDKSLTDLKINNDWSSPCNICFFYHGYKFNLNVSINSSKNLCIYSNIDSKFSKNYSVNNFSFLKVLFDYFVEKGYNPPSLKEFEYNLKTYIQLKNMFEY